MAIHQKLHAGLAQKLILTPALQQAIKLLPMSTLELVDILNQEVVENPMLEEVSEEELQSPDTTVIERTETAQSSNEKNEEWNDSDYEHFFGDYLDDGYRSRPRQEVKDLPPIENVLSALDSLSDHLIWQLSLHSEEGLTREVGLAIIGNLNDDGYLVASISEISAMGGWPPDQIKEILSLLQTFDPIGVAARDIQECLALQLRHLGFGGTKTEKIVTDHLSLLENQQLPELGRILGFSSDELKRHIDVIKNLDPKPGSRYCASTPNYITPDVDVIKVEGRYEAVLNDDGLPRLRISPVYRRLLNKDGDANEETRSYVKEKFRSALWLLKSVDQRQKTIQKVSASIVRFQCDFLEHGVEHLRPLVLKDVANDIGMHESTVSRVVNNKYMHTPQGVLELKYFFHSGINSARGASVSSIAIKQRIKKIIENENPSKPFSDSKIVEILNRAGLMLARRTVAKYREGLRIPTSTQRKVRL
jgi:RNA polymerase sigma-54 factor